MLSVGTRSFLFLCNMSMRYFHKPSFWDKLSTFIFFLIALLTDSSIKEAICQSLSASDSFSKLRFINVGIKFMISDFTSSGHSVTAVDAIQFLKAIRSSKDSSLSLVFSFNFSMSLTKKESGSSIA